MSIKITKLSIRQEQLLSMARQTGDWNVGEDLKDIVFAQGFLIAAMEEDMPLKYVLGKVIRAIGVKEFSEKIGMPPAILLRVINPKHNPTQEILNCLLKPFGLKLSLATIENEESKKVC